MLILRIPMNVWPKVYISIFSNIDGSISLLEGGEMYILKELQPMKNVNGTCNLKGQNYSLVIRSCQSVTIQEETNNISKLTSCWKNRGSGPCRMMLSASAVLQETDGNHKVQRCRAGCQDPNSAAFCRLLLLS
ncbi:hypothetical protein M9H77_32179 [Catharanthus roseus]|uniref:Uncharacterized protein n=1 Tax=Catharanthus roseus TaxID=4058 RepID=A0ACC0A4W3_CATRO|nr:hypothetical protein M9H77_32179 [Catharanthus roseus]